MGSMLCRHGFARLYFALADGGAAALPRGVSDALAGGAAAGVEAAKDRCADVGGQAEMIDYARLLCAIAALEGGPRPPDSFGMYGISPAALSDYNARECANLATEDLANPELARAVALSHLAWIESRLEAHRQAATVRALAGCWRAGVRGWLRGKGRDYGAAAEEEYARLERTEAGR